MSDHASDREESSAKDRDRKIDNVILPLVIFGGVVVLGLQFAFGG